MPIKIFTALVVQDMQNDFMADGALPVAGAETVMAPIAAMAETFSRVIVTQDFRPELLRKGSPADVHHDCRSGVPP